MTILDLLSSKGIKARRVASTNGGEYHSPCPVCGGDDRFQAWPCPQTGKWTWYCRNCDQGGDDIQFLRHVDGLGYHEAYRRLGVESQASFRSLPGGARHPAEDPFTGLVRKLPPAQWCQKAQKLVTEAREALFSPAGERVLVWLERRGIEAREADVYQLGLLHGDKDKDCRWRPHSAWGLEDIEFEKDQVRRVRKKLWIPQGLVIPTISPRGMVSALRIRRPAADLRNPERDSKYIAVSSSALAPMTAVSRKARQKPEVWVVVESQLDALMIAERVNDHSPQLPVGAMAILSNTGKPCPETHKLLAAASLILVALDYDQAGKKGCGWWEKTYSQAMRWPTPHEKDPGEYYARGGYVYEWIREGLP